MVKYYIDSKSRSKDGITTLTLIKGKDSDTIEGIKSSVPERRVFYATREDSREYKLGNVLDKIPDGAYKVNPMPRNRKTYSSGRVEDFQFKALKKR